MQKSNLKQGAILLAVILLFELLFLMPRVATSAIAVCAIEFATYYLLLCILRRCGWRISLVCGAVIPLFVYCIQCLDGFFVPGEILANAALLSCVYQLKKSRTWMQILLPPVAACAALLLGTFLVHIWVKEIAAGMSLRMSLQLLLHPLISLLLASGLDALIHRSNEK